MNQQLETELKVGEIELSVFDQFPAIAIKFNDLLIEDKFIEKDVLIVPCVSLAKVIISLDSTLLAIVLTAVPNSPAAIFLQAEVC